MPVMRVPAVMSSVEARSLHAYGGGRLIYLYGIVNLNKGPRTQRPIS